MTYSSPAMLLSGPPRVGKTTVIRKLVPLLDPDAGGFYSPAVEENGQRVAFEVVTLDGQAALLSTKQPSVTFANEARLGNHRVNLDVIDSIIVPTLLDAAATRRVVIIDEIGPMEILSARFRDVVMHILNSKVIVIGAIAESPIPFLDQVKAHPRVALKTVTHENRNRLPKEACDEVQKFLHINEARHEVP